MTFLFVYAYANKIEFLSIYDICDNIYIYNYKINWFIQFKKKLIAKSYKKIYKIKILIWRKYSYLMNADVIQCSST